jgi:hypothetical protein
MKFIQISDPAVLLTKLVLAISSPMGVTPFFVKHPGDACTCTYCLVAVVATIYKYVVMV